MSFIAWADSRVGYPRIVFGTRVAADGTPLDPHGIRLPEIISPDAAIWNGDSFAVIGQTTTARGIVFVGSAGDVLESKAVDVPLEYSFVAVSASGTGVRLLYVRNTSNGVLDAKIIGARGDVLASVQTPLSAPLAAPPLGTRFVGAGRQTDFAIFGPSATVRIDRDGRVLANNPVTWPFDFFFPENIIAVGTDGRGFIVLRQAPQYYGDATLIASRFDDDAAFTGKALIDLPWMWKLLQSRPVVVPVEDGYLVVNAGLYGDDSAHEYVTRLSFDASAQTTEVADAGVPRLIAKGSSRSIVVTSRGPALYVQTLSESLAASDPILLNVSPVSETYPAVVEGPTGYAVAWRKQSPYGQTFTYVRRFSPTGEALDAFPLEVNRSGFGAPDLTSTVDDYIVEGRRLDAFTGQWIDDASDPQVIAEASNGVGALLAVARDNGIGLKVLTPARSSALQVIPIFGFPAADLASNGTDYLLVWNSYTICYSLCAVPPTPIYALPVGADGMPSGASPIQLSPNGTSPSVEWTGNTYVVAWTASDGIRATRVDESGNALDGAGDGVIIEPARGAYENRRATILPRGPDGEMIVLLQSSGSTGSTGESAAMRLDPNDLAASTTIATDLPGDGSDAGAWVAGRLVLAYSARFGEATGYVSRVAVQLFADPNVRRRTVSQ